MGFVVKNLGFIMFGMEWGFARVKIFL